MIGLCYSDPIVSGYDFGINYNAPFLDEAMARNGVFQLATVPNNKSMYVINMDTGIKELTVFGREIQYLVQRFLNNYTI